MHKLKEQIAALSPLVVAGRPYLSYQAVADAVAAFLFPAHPTDQIDAAGYARILQTADSLCRELGYHTVVRLTPPAVPLNQMGLYWSPAPYPAADTAVSPPPTIHAGPTRAEMLRDGQLLDARLGQPGLDEVTRQHFNIPVTASDGVIDLLHRAAASAWPNDYRGVWRDILGMCIAGGQDGDAATRLFTVLIRGLGRRRYWRFRARLQQGSDGAPFLLIGLADEPPAAAPAQRFALGHVVMTPGAAALNVDFAPYLARHAAGDWGSLDDFDRRQNDTAVQEGYRILYAYNVPTAGGETTRIWIITEADR
ncbi:MAG: hypothetical protein KC425_26140, partial [Anaerolineales bacterium]|nr:hypothetical protein [Anaerolineales bacterium]